MDKSNLTSCISIKCVCLNYLFEIRICLLHGVILCSTLRTPNVFIYFTFLVSSFDNVPANFYIVYNIILKTRDIISPYYRKIQLHVVTQHCV